MPLLTSTLTVLKDSEGALREVGQGGEWQLGVERGDLLHYPVLQLCA